VELYFRYSAIMNFVFVTFTHGLALPILFPIAAFGIFNQWLVEKLMFAYFYKQPPLIDNKLNDYALSILQKAPICMLILGYWQLGNREMFFNSPSELENARDVADSQHTLFHGEDGLSHIYIFICFLPIFGFFEPYLFRLQQLMFKMKLFAPSEHFDLEWNLTVDMDEDLGKYWECIPGMKQKRWFAQVTHLKEHLKINTITDVAIENLRVSKRGPKFISNIHNYDMLQNRAYADKFFYQTMERRSEHESSDMIA